MLTGSPSVLQQLGGGEGGGVIGGGGVGIGDGGGEECTAHTRLLASPPAWQSETMYSVPEQTLHGTQPSNMLLER